MTINGHRKGKRGELEVAALLQPWWRTLEPEAKFIRVPLSGGWSSADVRAEFRASGDLMTTALHFPLSVEVKFREQYAWKNVYAGRKSPVWLWWVQALQQGREANLHPCLWLRHCNEPWQVMLDLQVALQLVREGLVMQRFLRQVEGVPARHVGIIPAAALLAVGPEALVTALSAVTKVHERGMVAPEVPTDATTAPGAEKPEVPARAPAPRRRPRGRPSRKSAGGAGAGASE